MIFAKRYVKWQCCNSTVWGAYLNIYKFFFKKFQVGSLAICSELFQAKFYVKSEYGKACCITNRHYYLIISTIFGRTALHFFKQTTFLFANKEVKWLNYLELSLFHHTRKSK